MRTRLRRAAIGVATLVVTTAVAASGQASAHANQQASIPTAVQSSGSSIVGVIFRPGSDDQVCTATVINSHTQNLVLTAAHCLTGSGAGWRFAPDYHSGKAPLGTWTATGAYALPGWLSGQDPQEDMAILKIAPQTIAGKQRTLQSVTGAADIGLAPATGQSITDIAYNNGSGEPIACTTQVYWTGSSTSFDCHGYIGGSSGSPWLVATDANPRVVGVIGGLNQGGCEESTSYSSAFGNNIISLWLHAEGSPDGDVLPAAGSSGC
ncbi:trypsin-like serine peptidase [Flexivirga caeni]|uniref:Peptidase S1 domain-containing protein n=1 Tax=Flexivirga caeni TaxID=2294115 RepID=A0A3M9LZK3_9MICO|nr:trypsin-like peptidase domain-containing protein [Flexivirga caeni]RNI17778.1 hypothetical protein EFY87_19105 [Flexivirga caeni]